jgi:PadR family transcriptional regulator PadR
MSRTRSLSPAARSVLFLLAEAGPEWSYGYDLCRKAGVKSGTLYPLLIRLEHQKHLEAKWLPPRPGRPPRHVYRLTASGRRLASENPPIEAPRTTPIERPA